MLINCNGKCNVAQREYPVLHCDKVSQHFKLTTPLHICLIKYFLYASKSLNVHLCS